MRVIVMGVSGCGKTTFGVALAERLGIPFIEGDRLHPPANIAKMSAGTPLEDADRWPWLAAVGAALAAEESAVASCSALKRVYRERLRDAAGRGLRFVWLDLPLAALRERMATRTGHFMPSGLLDSQIATLESPLGEPNAFAVDGTLPTALGVDQALELLRAG